MQALAALEDDEDLPYIEQEFPRAIARVLDGVQRVAHIVGAMKRFAHPETRTKAPADINAALLDTVTVARNEIKYVADVETTLQTLPMVKCHLSDLNQVFLNLLVNAAHAISDRHGRDNKGKSLDQHPVP